MTGVNDLDVQAYASIQNLQLQLSKIYEIPRPINNFWEGGGHPILTTPVSLFPNPEK